MPNKKLFFITGTTCAGKSTLLHALKDSAPESVYIVPQTTVRAQRSDDEIGDFRYVSSLNLSEMFLHDTEHRYGVAWQDIASFQKSQQPLGAAIVSCDEIEMLAERKSKIPDIECQSVLMTFTSSVEGEIKMLDETLTKFFDEKNKKLRMDFFSNLIRERLLSPTFIETKIHIHLTRETDEKERYSAIAKVAGIPVQLLAAQMKKIIAAKDAPRHYLTQNMATALCNTR